MNNVFVRHAAIAVALLWTAVAQALPEYDDAHAARYAEDISFNRDIRPILVSNCFACHGDASALEGNVLLKTFEDAIGASGFETVIHPGDAAASLVYRRVSSPHPEMRMPPKETGKQLSADEVELVRRWIDQGATYEEHWSYRPVERPPVPAVADGSWVRNPIDAFILQRIEAQGLAPSPMADNRSLVRRLHFDLHGLIPPAQRLSQYHNIDSDEHAYRELVDVLLAAPHYGERMALPWLDWAGYADEISDRGNYLTSFYPYRNYVIDAFNHNKPFDRFTIEQLAGDLLPDAGSEQLIASGYNHLVVRVQDGVGYDTVHGYITDRVDKLGETWLASSLECAQCHDHKFDPFLHKDYYQLAAFFSDLDRVGVWSTTVSGDSTEPRNPDSYFKFPRVYLPTDEQRKRLQQIDAELAALRAELQSRESREQIRALDKTLRDRLRQEPDYFAWISPEVTSAVVVGNNGPQPMKVEAGRPPGGNAAIVTDAVQYLQPGEIEAPGTEYRIAFPIDHDKVSALMIRISSERARDIDQHLRINLAGEGPVSIRQVEAHIGNAEPGGVREPLRFSLVESTDLGLRPTHHLVDGDHSTVWTVHPRDLFHKYRYERKDDLLLKSIHNEVYLVFYLQEPIVNRRGEQIELVIHHADNASLSRKFSVSYTSLEAASPFQAHAASAVQSRPLMRKIRQRIYDFIHTRVFFTDFMDFTVSSVFSWYAVKQGVSAPVPFNDVMKSTLATLKENLAFEEIHRDHLVLRHPQFRDIGTRVRELEREQEKLWGEVERSWVSESASRRWTVRVFAGGDPMDRTGELVERELPGFLMPEDRRRPERELNRLDLARWLVSEENPLTARVIVNRLWQLFMGEAIVKTTEDFGSGGELPTHPELLDWLASEFMDSGWDIKHMVRLVVESSTYRQQSLMSEELRAVDPENTLFARQNRFRIDAEFIQDYILQVSGLLREGVGGEHTLHDVDAPEDADRFRRSIYLLRKNMDVPPQLMAFGARPRVKSVIHRPSSTTPLQALAGLNQPLRVKAAEIIAAELLAEGEEWSPREKLAWIYQRVLQRDPGERERELFERSQATWSEAGDSRPASDADSYAFWLKQVRALLSVREATLRT